MSEYVSAALKRLVFDRAKGMCEYCRSLAKYAVDSFVLHHEFISMRSSYVYTIEL